MVSSVRLFAQASSQDEIIQKLLQRVDALEREVAALQPAQTPGGCRQPSSFQSPKRWD